MCSLMGFAKIVKWDSKRDRFYYREDDLKTLNEDIFTSSLDRSQETPTQKQAKAEEKETGKDEGDQKVNQIIQRKEYSRS